MQIPVSYVPQILAELVRAGIAASLAGRTGGYELALQPAEVSLLDLVQAVDGDVTSSSCVLRGGPCRWEDMCAVHVPWLHAQQALLGSLAGTTLAELVAIDARLEAGTFEADGLEEAFQPRRRRADSVPTVSQTPPKTSPDSRA